MLERILVPVDGTEIFAETLGYLKELGQETSPEVRFLHVQETGTAQPAGDASAHPLLKKYFDALSSQNWQVSAELCSGDPVEEITRCAVQLPASLLRWPSSRSSKRGSAQEPWRR